MDKEYIAFEGAEFTIEWYFDKKGKSIAFDYFKSMNEKQQLKLIDLFRLMGSVGEIKNKERFNNEGDKIYAFKPQPYRFLCFFYEGRKIIVTHAFYKKTQKLPLNEKEKALSLKHDYEIRIKRGDYYD
ncbi:MAG: type II toxin-antitoxin system RelE/ParE family toxin [Proteobacteria bacterium]|nr:type II toxin-antitoxin system RelE/ParE family toxin [Pseudomonadota bacterium]